MQKKVLLIHKGKSFMLNTIVKNLVDDGYEVVEAAPEMEEIAAHKGETELILMYLGDYVDDAAGTLVYLKDICTEEDKLLVLVGTATEIETLKSRNTKNSMTTISSKCCQGREDYYAAGRI